MTIRIDRRTLTRLGLALALTAAVGLAGPGEALANFYRCTQGSRVWVTNHKPKGARCRLIMKTKTRAPDPESTSADGAAKKKKKRHYDVRPRTPRKPAGPPKLPDDRLWQFVQEAAERYHLPPAFLVAVMRVESNFNPRAVSRVGARGLMQLMPATAAELGVKDSFDPRQNIMGGAKYLRLLANRFDGDLARTIAGYHAGGGAVAKKQGVPWAATEQYVRWVLDRYYEYKPILKAKRP